MLADDRYRLSGSNVVTRSPVFISRDTIEVLLKNLLSPRQPIAPAHNEIMADESLWENTFMPLCPYCHKQTTRPCGEEFQSLKINPLARKRHQKRRVEVLNFLCSNRMMSSRRVVKLPYTEKHMACPHCHAPLVIG